MHIWICYFVSLAHFQAQLSVSTPATSLNICNTEMYNDNLSNFSFDDIIDVFICYIVSCNTWFLLYFLLKL